VLNHNFHILKIVHTTGVATEPGRGRSTSSEGHWHIKVKHSQCLRTSGKSCWEEVVAGHLFRSGSEGTPSAYLLAWSTMPAWGQQNLTPL